MRALLVFIGKDLRLLWRDRAGLMFLLVAPLIVITVAGFSLANLYGADPTGQTAYDVPLVDEDGGPAAAVGSAGPLAARTPEASGGRVGSLRAAKSDRSLAQQIRERLAGDPAVRVHEVPSREAAQQLVRRKLAGTALVIPAGTDAALAAGRDAHLILYDDPVKYLERINIRTRMLELRDALAADRASRLTSDAAAQRQRAAAALADLRTRGAEVREEITTVWHDARDARLQVIEQARHEAARTREEAAAKIKEELQRTAADVHTQIERQTDALREELRIYVDSSLQTRADFDKWLGELRRLAGSRAGDIPAPPQFPELPDELQAILDGKRPLVELPPPPVAIELPPLRVPELPPLPELPVIEIPDLALPEAPAAPATLVIDEVNLTGGPSHINTFDQNVPGFAVTFLMLGMLLGISLGLLDEREWGTFERMRALPVGPAQFMLAKLLSRFLVGVGQMILLLAVGWLAFGVSLGPQPAALLLPTVGIAFAGTACGLIVAALARSREAVFSVGSVVMVTMAAVGGCWWPIDLEPRWMRSVALAFPTTWAMDAFNDLMIRRRGIEAAWAPTAVMLGYGAAYLVVGLVIFRGRRRA